LHQHNASLQLRRHQSLYYRISLDLDLSVKRYRLEEESPKRGGLMAFQTDLCVFESREGRPALPRVVLEFKVGLSTHDVLTYSAKARGHKQAYPWLRYGLVVHNPVSLAKFLRHNEALDFCIGAVQEDDASIRAKLEPLILAELAASRCLERLTSADESSKEQLFQLVPIETAR
jgi:hypothetical protein